MGKLKHFLNEPGLVAGGPGFEPELPGPEPGVLPLNYPPKYDGNVKFTVP